MGSPIVVYSFDPNQVKVDNVKLESTLNKKFSFNIDASQAGQGFIRVSIKGNLGLFSWYHKHLRSVNWIISVFIDSKLNDILPEIVEVTDRKYLISFLPKISGKYHQKQIMLIDF